MDFELNSLRNELKQLKNKDKKLREKDRLKREIRQLRIKNSPGGRFISKVQGLAPKAKTRRKNRGNFAKSSRRFSKNLDNVFSSL